MISALPTTPDSGMPPAIPLATVIRSGSKPSSHSLANHFPVLAIPLWTSSATKTMPFALVHS